MVVFVSGKCEGELHSRIQRLEEIFSNHVIASTLCTVRDIDTRVILGIDFAIVRKARNLRIHS